MTCTTAGDLEWWWGVRRGSGSVLCWMNGPAHRWRPGADRMFTGWGCLGSRPCRNTSSLRLKTRDVLDVFLKHTGHTATVVDL